MAEFNHLPNESIQKIFLILPLLQLISLRRVCHRWSDQIRRVFETKRSLKLFDSKHNFDEYRKDIQKYHLVFEDEFRLCNHDDGYQDNVMFLTETETAAWTLVADFFPNVTQLVFYFDQVDHFIPLMANWNARLTSLVLFGPISLVCNANRPSPVIPVINSLTTLRRLHLFDFFNYQLPNDMTVLAQLEHLTLVRYQLHIPGVLNQLGPNCTSLNICSCAFYVNSLISVNRVRPGLLNELRSLRISHLYYTLSDDCYNVLQGHQEVVRFTEQHCPNLQSLDLTNALNIKLSTMHPPESLTTLKVCLEQLATGLTLARMPNITSVYIDDDGTEYEWRAANYYPALANMFPGLQQLVIDSVDLTRIDYLKNNVIPRIAFRNPVSVTYRHYQFIRIPPVAQN